MDGNNESKSAVHRGQQDQIVNLNQEDGAKQSKAKQSKAEQSRAEQSRAE